jgi:hypothetical protein
MILIGVLRGGDLFLRRPMRAAIGANGLFRRPTNHGRVEVCWEVRRRCVPAVRSASTRLKCNDTR